MSEGFFTTEEMEGAEANKRVGCTICKLRKNCVSPMMKPSGKGKKGILIIGEAPSKRADKKGKPFAGRDGRLLRAVLNEGGVDLDEDCRLIYSVNCRLPKDRKPPIPTSQEVNACRPFVFKEIEAFKPKLIILLGQPAVQSVIGHRWKSSYGLGPITKWRGWCIPDRDLNAWICPTLSPSIVRHQQKESIFPRIWATDLGMAISTCSWDFPEYVDETQYVQTTTDPKKIIQYLEKLNKKKMAIAFDYETTGLKPHGPDHRIVSCAIAESVTKAKAFPVTPPIHAALKAVLKNKNLLKVAANMKFEDAWSREHLGCRVRGWIFDTMQAAHVLDNRTGVTGVKFQTYVRFGVIDYDSHLSRYLKGIDDSNANSLNRIDQVDMKDLLIYNGLDAIYEMKLMFAMKYEML